jgi:hypothetical protein
VLRLGRSRRSEPRNIQIDYRFAASNPDLIKKCVAEVVSSAPDVIAASSTSSAQEQAIMDMPARRFPPAVVGRCGWDATMKLFSSLFLADAV